MFYHQYAKILSVTAKYLEKIIYFVYNHKHSSVQSANLVIVKLVNVTLTYLSSQNSINITICKGAVKNKYIRKCEYKALFCLLVHSFTCG